ncbi:MAG TPA: thiamine-phosphate synthase family protein, partial [Methanomicrobiales archaeon]|nr:thiamine-phosphate synthase family protein [Methanomicrobiales archaeon]
MNVHEREEMYGRMCIAVDWIERCREFASLIPEVRTNFVYAASDAETPQDVLAVDGRITVRNGMPHACGKPRFGASSHMARAMIEIRRVDPSIRAAINFASDPDIVKWLTGYCGEKGWNLIGVDRSLEPEEVKAEEQASMPWKVGELFRLSGGVVPKLFYESGAVGKEPVTALVGPDPLTVAREMCEIACLYAQARSPAPKIGKIDLKTFENVVLSHLGKRDPSVLVPPMTGIDAGVI